jgi:hypothetical protein
MTTMAPIDAFIRDDDAGWNDERLFPLLDTVARAGAPIDLATIPAAIAPALANELCARIDAGGVAVHQHGFSHDNHQREGRKGEFGSHRDVATQRSDIARGRALLRERFGARAQPIFTPPWNRCVAFTPSLLASLGFAALSRDRGAVPTQQALAEIAVDVDWSRCWRDGGAPAVRRDFERARRRCAAARQPLGLMLHHAVMGDDELRALQALLTAERDEGRVRWRAMADTLPAWHGAAA